VTTSASATHSAGGRAATRARLVLEIAAALIYYGGLVAILLLRLGV
jgi:hypothetical protein